MKHTRPSAISKFFAAFFFVFAFAQGVFAQQNAPQAGASNPLAYLEQTFPKLTNLYRGELSKYPAHYIFAVDVSGTMNQYSGVVTQSLSAFFQALPDGDRVDVIPFGTTALPGMMSYSGTINAQVRADLCNNIGRLYNDPSYPAGFKGYTDMVQAIDAVSSTIQRNRDYKVNVIVVLTDFRNDIVGPAPTERKLTADEISGLNERLGAATHNMFVRSVALELPVDTSARGYCIKQLKDEVFPQEGSGLEIVPMTSPSAIGQWFDQLKREIMVIKLRAVIDIANKMNPVRMNIKTNIDGKTTAEIHWTPNKLYPMMKIDSTYVGQQGFYFVNKKENFQTTRDSVIGVNPELLLGQVKHESFFFHHIEDSLHLGIDLPTDYDDELIALGVKKPLPATTQAIDKWVFTFFLPFWLFCTICALIILYIIGVIKAMRRNSKCIFSAKIQFMDRDGYPLESERRVKISSKTIKIGNNASPKCDCSGADWQIVIEKKNGNPFLVFAKPYYEWKQGSGFVSSGRKNKRAGRLDYQQNTALSNAACGTSRDDITHKVTIKMLS